MPIAFRQLAPMKLDLSTGQIYGAQGNALSTEPTYGIPKDELANQIAEAVQAGHSAEEIHSAIDQHPDITDKPGAKSFTDTILSSLGETAKTAASDIGGTLFPALGHHSEAKKQDAYLEGFKQQLDAATTADELDRIMAQAQKLITDKNKIGDITAIWAKKLKTIHGAKP